MIPGRTTSVNLQADEPGEYHGQCKEFCGISHANMRLVVIAHEPAEFSAWLAGQQEDAQPADESLARQGEEFFTEDGQCAQCHAIQGVTAAERNVGPDLTHFASRECFAGCILQNDSDEDLRRWLENPPAVKAGSWMPPYNLSDQQITELIAYLRTLE